MKPGGEDGPHDSVSAIEREDAPHDWESFLEKEYPRLLLCVTLMVHGAACAEDIVQEGVWRVLKSVPRFDAITYHFSYLMKAMRRVFYEELGRTYIFSTKKKDGHKGGEGEGDKGDDAEEEGGEKSYPRFDSYDDPQNKGLLESLGEAGDGGGPQRRLEKEEHRRILLEALGELSDREWLLFEMSYLNGMKPKAIAEELGENPKLVGVEVNALRSKVNERVERAILCNYALRGACGKR